MRADERGRGTVAGWETHVHPDPHGRTLEMIAQKLAGSFRGPVPVDGVPLFEAWGMDVVGVFFESATIEASDRGDGWEGPQRVSPCGRSSARAGSFASLYQAPRLPNEAALFDAALIGMSKWYANVQTTVYLVGGQDGRLSTPRAARGWPTYEQRMASLLKQGPAPESYHTLNQRFLALWTKTQLLGGKTMDVVIHPPRAPSRFERDMAALTFTSASDKTAVLRLYKTTIVDGFRSVPMLTFASAGWYDAEVDELATALSEVSCPKALVLSLRGNLMSTLESLGKAVAKGALPALRVLNLCECARLQTLPDSLCAGLGASLRACSRVELHKAFTALPQGPRRLRAQRTACTDVCVSTGTLVVRDSAITELPHGLGALRRLRELDAKGCTRLTRLPDSLGSLHELCVLNLAGCRRLTVLPRSVGDLTKLELLNLVGCPLATMPTSLLRLMRSTGKKNLCVLGLPEHTRCWTH
jgi:hypothetical protein